MNFKIIDAKKDYIGLSEKFPDNFYMNLAEKVVRRFTPTAINSGLDVTFKSKGNDVHFTVGPKGITITVGGRSYSSKEVTLPALEGLLYEIYQDDLKGEIEINHGNSSVVEDRMDFNKASNTVFRKLFKSVKFDKSGSKNVEVSGARSNAPVMTEIQYKNACAVKSFKKDNFKPVKVDGTTYYLNKGVDLISASSLTDGKYTNPSGVTVNSILSNINGNLGWWARSKSLEKLLKNLGDLTTTLFSYKGNAWLIKPGTTSYELIRL